MIDYFLGDALGFFSWPLWNTALWCGAAADTHLKQLDRVVSGASFLTRGVFECNLAHRRSAAAYVRIICILYKIRCNPLHNLYGALLVRYVLVCVTGSVVHLCVSSLQNLAV